MPYNFTPLEYNPFQVTNPLQPPNAHDYLDNHGGPGGWGYAEAQRNYPYQLADQRSSQFQDYGQNQFQSLFDAVNSIGASPFTSGDAFYNTPQYTAVSRDPYTTQHAGQTVLDDPTEQTYRYVPAHTTFDQRGYDTARMDNMMNYLTDLGGFFRSMGSNPAQQAQQQIINNAPSQGPALPPPSFGTSYGLSQAGGNSPFATFTPQSGGWGTAPTSLFGAGAGNK